MTATEIEEAYERLIDPLKVIGLERRNDKVDKVKWSKNPMLATKVNSR